MNWPPSAFQGFGVFHRTVSILFFCCVTVKTIFICWFVGNWSLALESKDGVDVTFVTNVRTKVLLA